jgi:hypothetical protein
MQQLSLVLTVKVLDAFVFVDQANQNRYPARDGLDTPAGLASNALTANEVQTLLNEAIGLANQSRAQIRVPAGTQARVHGVYRRQQRKYSRHGSNQRWSLCLAPDVSLQKARTATFFSGTGRAPGEAPADILRGFPEPLYMAPTTLPIDFANLETLNNPLPSLSRYVVDAQIFFGDGDALESTGTPVAFADRSGGNLSRPNFP